MGDFLQRTRAQRGYNEIIVDGGHWPNNIVEASFGDRTLPRPHLCFDAEDLENPFYTLAGPESQWAHKDCDWMHGMKDGACLKTEVRDQYNRCVQRRGKH